MKPGDLIDPGIESLRVRSIPNPTFSSRGRERLWTTGTPALVLSVTKHDLKLEILIDGERWWVGNLKCLKLLSRGAPDDVSITFLPTAE